MSQESNGGPTERRASCFACDAPVLIPGKACAYCVRHLPALKVWFADYRPKA